ncbi:WhiB family transcriptional regulator [Streptomyces chumphonensis]|uniref:WhiB family transcriptional regulator n=1 Tax=Streptomyces chumphonensis TaxID=1214925 RepID=UPI003D706CF8
MTRPRSLIHRPQPPATTAGGDDWRLRGICRDEDPEIWFPVGTTGPAYAEAEWARQICCHCPVMEACAEYALDERIEHGIWGGLDEQQRRKILRKRGRGIGRGNNPHSHPKAAA